MWRIEGSRAAAPPCPSGARGAPGRSAVPVRRGRGLMVANHDGRPARAPLVPCPAMRVLASESGNARAATAPAAGIGIAARGTPLVASLETGIVAGDGRATRAPVLNLRVRRKAMRLVRRAC